MTGSLALSLFFNKEAKSGLFPLHSVYLGLKELMRKEIENVREASMCSVSLREMETSNH